MSERPIETRDVEIRLDWGSINFTEKLWEEPDGRKHLSVTQDFDAHSMDNVSPMVRIRVIYQKASMLHMMGYEPRPIDSDTLLWTKESGVEGPFSEIVEMSHKSFEKISKD